MASSADDVKQFLDSYEIISLPSPLSNSSSSSSSSSSTDATIKLFVHEKRQYIARHSSDLHLLGQVDIPVVEMKHHIFNFHQTPSTCYIDALVSDLLSSCNIFHDAEGRDSLQRDLSSSANKMADDAKTADDARPEYIEIVADVEVVTQYEYRFGEEAFEQFLRERDSCSICMEKFFMEGEVAKMPCSHKFHERCIVEWKRRKSTCPLCRFQLMAV